MIKMNEYNLLISNFFLLSTTDRRSWKEKEQGQSYLADCFFFSLSLFLSPPTSKAWFIYSFKKILPIVKIQTNKIYYTKLYGLMNKCLSFIINDNDNIFSFVFIYYGCYMVGQYNQIDWQKRKSGCDHTHTHLQKHSIWHLDVSVFFIKSISERT